MILDGFGEHVGDHFAQKVSHLGLLWAPLGLPGPLLGLSWPSFGFPLALLRPSWALLGLPLRSLWTPWASLGLPSWILTWAVSGSTWIFVDLDMGGVKILVEGGLKGGPVYTRHTHAMDRSD